MKNIKKSIYMLALSTAILLYSSAMAFQVSVEDVSNKIITCDSPLLESFPDGSCLSYPDKTVLITVELEENENENLLENIHIVLEQNNELYEYNTTPDDSNDFQLWKKIQFDETNPSLLLTSCCQRLPLETRTISRQIELEGFYETGNKIFIGLRPNNVSGFSENSIKEIFEIP